MILMLAPGAAGDVTIIGAPTGSVYVANEFGLIFVANNSALDQSYLQGVGCRTLAPFVAGTNPATQTGNFALTSQYGFWPVNLTGAFAVALPTDFTADAEFIIKDILGNASNTNVLTASGANVDDAASAVLIQEPYGFVKLTWSVELSIWSITG